MEKLTIKEVAQAAGVSTATISRVLNDNGYVSDEARKRVLETIERLQYKPNTIARSLKQERTGGIGFVLPDLTNPYFIRISRTLQQRLANEGYYVFFMDSGESQAKERQALVFLLEKRVEAILLAGTGGNVDLLRQMEQSPVPLVLLDRQIAGIHTDIVMEENRTAAAEAIGELIRRGHKRIGLLHGPAAIATAQERQEGAIQGLQYAGVALDETYQAYGDYTREAGIRAIRQFMQLPEPPTAVFSANNEMTFGIFLGLKQLGLPLDSLEIVTFGELEFSGLFDNKLLVIQQAPEAVAEAAVELLLRRLRVKHDASPERRILAPRLSW